MDTAVILAFLSAIVGFSMAATAAFSARRSVAHWSFVVGMAELAAEITFSGLAADAVLPEAARYWQNWRLFVMSCLPGTWLLFSLTYSRGNAREFLVRWRLPLAAAFLAPMGLAILFRGELIVSAGRTETGYIRILGLGPPGLVLYLLFLVSAVLIMMNLERTFRASVGTTRWRIKFTVLGLGVLFAARTYTSSQVLLFRAIDFSHVAVNSGALLLACLLILRSLLRAGHFEVSVYPSHSVLHNSLTVLLAGLYLVIVGAFAKVVTFLGGDSAFQLKAFLVLVLLVLLTVLLLSDRVRLQTRRFVSRHFQRPLYDYRTVWRTVTEGTTRRVEQTDLCEAIVKLVSEIFQTLSVTIWLVDERKEQLAFGASTSLSENKAGALALDAADAALVIGALSNHPGPVDLDASKEIWASSLRRLQPDEFRKGGNRIGVPMSAGGELLGVMTLGDRVGGVPFALQDFDLLKSVGDQAAAGLLNIQLSQRLSQTKQLEAFQAMSAFFVHDLKNTASTLSLMLQNLPVHFNDPKFREDALRGVSKTVTHINDLITRLGLLRRELSIQTVESDLNELVTNALKGLAQEQVKEPSSQLSTFNFSPASSSRQSPAAAEALAPAGQLSTSGSQPSAFSIQPSASGSQLSTFSFQLSAFRVELRPLPKVHLDPGQIETVITNLVLNASEAIGPGGQVRVETSQRNGCVILAVSDNGCGMAPEFVQRSLFRPFQTTKKQGIGIGMFQCKMIVEAHRGRIEVDTEPGKGTTFRVLLPLDQKISDNS